MKKAKKIKKGEKKMKKIIVISLFMLICISSLFAQDVLVQYWAGDANYNFVDFVGPDGNPAEDGWTLQYYVSVDNVIDGLDPVTRLPLGDDLLAVNQENGYYEDALNGEINTGVAGQWYASVPVQTSDPVGSPEEPVINLGDYFYIVLYNHSDPVVAATHYCTSEMITAETTGGPYDIPIEVWYDDAWVYLEEVPDQEIVVNELMPVDFTQTIDETEAISFLIDAYDPDGNDLEYSWQVDAVEVSTDSTYDFETDYTSAGVYVVTLFVTDNYGTRNELNYTWDVTVNDVDQEIVVNEILPPEGDLEIDETETIEFSIDAYDPDGNDLEYSWQVDAVEVSTEASYYFETDYTSAGDYVVTLDVTDNFVSRNELNFLWNVTVNDVVGSGEIILPNITKLYQNHPNPFNPTTNIQFDIKENETGILTIFNTKGQMIMTQHFNSGKYDYRWDASRFSSGVYFYQLHTESTLVTKKMLLLK